MRKQKCVMCVYVDFVICCLSNDAATMESYTFLCFFINSTADDEVLNIPLGGSGRCLLGAERPGGMGLLRFISNTVLCRRRVIPLLQNWPVLYTHPRAHETLLDLVCRFLLEKKNENKAHIVCRILLSKTQNSQPNHPTLIRKPLPTDLLLYLLNSTLT